MDFFDNREEAARRKHQDRGLAALDLSRWKQSRRP
jgi:hypothetical protein